MKEKIKFQSHCPGVLIRVGEIRYRRRGAFRRTLVGISNIFFLSKCHVNVLIETSCTLAPLDTLVPARADWTVGVVVCAHLLVCHPAPVGVLRLMSRVSERESRRESVRRVGGAGVCLLPVSFPRALSLAPFVPATSLWHTCA